MYIQGNDSMSFVYHLDVYGGSKFQIITSFLTYSPAWSETSHVAFLLEVMADSYA